MTERSWRWLRIRITSLVDRPPTYVPWNIGDVPKFLLVPSTRLGFELNPPVFE